MPGLRRLALVLAALVLVGCTGPAPAPVAQVAATADPQALVLAHVYAAALRHAGSPAEVVVTDDPLAGLDSGAITVLPGFTGRLLRTFQPDDRAAPRSDRGVYRAMVAALPEGIAAGDYATAAQDKPALAVTVATADAWGGPDLRLLPRRCRDLLVGAVAGHPVPPKVGSCRLTVREFPDTATQFAALRDGRIGAAWTSTAAPALPAGAVLLVDDKPALVQAENVVPLYRRGALTEPQLVSLNEVAGVLDTAGLAEMHRRVERGADPTEVVDAWLADNPLRR